MKYESEIFPLLRALLTNIRLLIALLKSDVTYFKENNLMAIEKNNEEKYIINNRLNEVIQSILVLPSLMPYPGTLNDKLLQYTCLLSLKEQNELEDLVNTMTVEMRTYKQLMVVNRQVLNSNLTFIKDLFLTLVVSNNEEPQSTYSSMGVLEKL